MKITNGVKIAVANKILCVKTLVARLIITIIMLATVFSFAKIIILPIIKSEELKQLLNLLREAIKNFIMMKPDAGPLDFKTAISNLLQFVYSKTTSIVWASIAILLVIQVMTFLLSICDFIIGVNINEHMSSMRHAGFFNTLFENFKNACRYAGSKTLFLFIYNVVVITLMVFLFIALIGEIGLHTFSIMMFLAIFSVAVKLSIIGQVLPKIVCENKKAFKSFVGAVKESKPNVFMQRLISYFITCVAVVVIVAVSSFVTFNVSFLITLPLSSVTFISLRFVDYYTINHKKYYVTFDDVVIPKELRKNDEHLLNQVDI